MLHFSSDPEIDRVRPFSSGGSGRFRSRSNARATPSRPRPAAAESAGRPQVSLRRVRCSI